MTRLERENLLCSIQITAKEVATIYGEETVNHILKKYDSRSIWSLSPAYYSAVFDELYCMANDARD